MRIWSRKEVNENIKHAKSEYFKNGYNQIAYFLLYPFMDCHNLYIVKKR